ncbi:hypothetical protein OAC89_05145 [Deltaproteobacteria bacterium]|nr:hypothetical protein [Deltaproteobacteria bacterium]
MDSDQLKSPPIREKPPDREELTVMIIRSVGKIRSFKISRRAVLWVSIFLFAYIVASLYTFNRFFDLRYLYRIQSEKLERSERDMNENARMLLQTKDYVAGLEDYLKDISDSRALENRPDQKETGTEGTLDRTAADSDKENEDKQKRFKTVDIMDAIIQKEDSGMSVDFKLVNTAPEENAMDGYVHIIAMDNKNSYPSEWNYPDYKLQDGFPVNFRRGQPFFIQRFKSYHRQFNMNSNSELPTTIRVLVYDQSGELILTKEFEVSNAS